MSSTDSSAADHAYFQAIERRFVELRGAPLLLAPGDWQLTRDWHRRGIPLELVLDALTQVFAAREARGATGKVQGLRYCAPAIERAWEERQALLATGRRQAAPAFDLESRLSALCAALTDRDVVPSEIIDRIRGLEGTPEAVERRLSELDHELIAAVSNALEDDVLAEVERTADESVAKVEARLGATETSRIRERLIRESIRRRLDLPVLSLFHDSQP
jgi:hypothetical protein